MPRPSLAKGWKLSEDGKTFILYLRRSLRWPDAHPMTADDFVFWFEDIYNNKDLNPTPIPDMTPEGKPGRIVKVDDFTVNFEFDVPFYLFEELMAGDTLIGGGQAVRQSNERSHGAYAPSHYLEQFLPKYAGRVEAAEAAAKAAGFDNWVARLHFKKDWTLNPEVPVLGTWRTTRPIDNPTWAMERNPYSWAVDTEDNQLPYLDGVVMTLAENLELLNLRAIAGEYDVQERHVDIGKLPVILENQAKGNYKVHLDLAFNGAIAIYQFNQSYTADPEIAKWLKNADFRRALSLAIDRNQLNKTFWLGTAVPGSPAPADVGQTYEPFQYRTLLQVSAALGLPYAYLSNDMLKAHYSNSRLALLEFRRRVDAYQHAVMVWQICRRVWTRWMDMAVMAGALDLSDYKARRRD